MPASEPLEAAGVIAQCPAGTVVPPDTSPPMKPSGEVDPVLKKQEKGTDQHG